MVYTARNWGPLGDRLRCCDVVPPKVLVTKISDDLIPMSGITKHSGGDTTAAWTDEQSSHGVGVDDVQPSQHQLVDLIDQRLSAPGFGR